MFSTAGNKSSLERRMKELEREAKLIQGDIKALSRALKKPDEITAAPRLKSTQPQYVKPPSRRDPILSEPRMEALEPEEAEDPQGEEDLFSWTPRSPVRPESAEPPSETDIQGPKPRQAVSGDKRFANYFTSGTFITPRPLRTEKNVQRNKAVFMVILLVLVGLWVFSLWFWR